MTGPLQKAIESLTDLKGAEELPLFRGIMDLLNDGAMIVDLEGQIIYVNNRFCEITGYARDELIGESAADILLPEELVPIMEVRTQHRQELRSESYELPVRRKDGETSFMRISASPIVNYEGKVIGSLGLHRDISDERKRALALKQALSEKELLLQETHHRVKNNLQIISSLLNLQVSTITDKDDAIRAFATCQNRIKAMALLHEIIYNWDESGHIDFNIYCKELLGLLVESLGTEEQNIELKTKLEPIQVSLDNALACGMIINELVTNAVEHAFGPEGGTIEISLIQGDPIRLVIADDGKGLPQDFNTDQSDTLGMMLVDSFVEQLDGTLRAENQGGSRFIITFDGEGNKTT